eukprot:4466664-Pyramimonas_sp.AAC.1
MEKRRGGRGRPRVAAVISAPAWRPLCFLAVAHARNNVAMVRSVRRRVWELKSSPSRVARGAGVARDFLAVLRAGRCVRDWCRS